MKILLIDPDYILNGEMVGLGILTIAEVCKKTNWEPVIQEYIEYISIESLFDNIINSIKSLNPSAVGISTRCDTYPLVLSLIKNIREENKDILVILGGPQATLTDVDSLEISEGIDIIIRGEGEVTTFELLNAIEKGIDLENISGITYRENGLVKKNKDREVDKNISYKVAWDLLPKRSVNYLKNEGKCSIESGRGCPYNCTFCCTNKIWNRFYRIRNADELYNEMVKLYYMFGIKHFSFEHDNLMAGRNFKAFLERLSEINIHNFTWGCSARIDNFDLELLPLLENAGCIKVYCGIESASPRMQAIYNKNLNLFEANRKIEYILLHSNIHLTLSFVCGHPLERLEDVLQTIEMTIKYEQYKNCENVQLHKLSPVCGSELFNKYKERLRYSGLISDQAKNPYIQNINFKDIEKYPQIFSSFYDFENSFLGDALIYDICYNWQLLFRSFARSITALILYKKMSLKEMFDLFLKKNMKVDFEIKFKQILMEYNVDNIIYNIFQFEFELYQLRKMEEEYKSIKVNKLCINPTAKKIHIFFDPDVEIKEESLKNSLYQADVIMWRSKDGANYKVITSIDNLLLSYSDVTGLKENKYLQNYIKQAIKGGLLLEESR